VVGKAIKCTSTVNLSAERKPHEMLQTKNQRRKIPFHNVKPLFCVGYNMLGKKLVSKGLKRDTFTVGVVYVDKLTVSTPEKKGAKNYFRNRAKDTTTYLHFTAGASGNFAIPLKKIHKIPGCCRVLYVVVSTTL
jgi:hypothetical protein